MLNIQLFNVKIFSLHIIKFKFTSSKKQKAVMKKLLLITFIFYGVSIFGEVNISLFDNKDNKNKAKLITEGIRTINVGDTVVFDLTQITDLGNVVSFPVSIISDDVIYALDFSLKYDQDVLDWDTIINSNTNVLQSVANYNITDSTLRYTSNSLQEFLLSGPITNIRFNVLFGVLDSSDLNIVAVYLNGEPCSFIVKVDATVGLKKTLKKGAFINVFPNPTSDMVNLSCSDDALAEIIDLSGKKIRTDINITAGQNISVETNTMATGIYFVRFSSSNKVQYRKLIIE